MKKIVTNYKNKATKCSYELQGRECPSGSWVDERVPSYSLNLLLEVTQVVKHLLSCCFALQVANRLSTAPWPVTWSKTASFGSFLKIGFCWKAQGHCNKRRTVGILFSLPHGVAKNLKTALLIKDPFRLNVVLVPVVVRDAKTILHPTVANVHRLSSK